VPRNFSMLEKKRLQYENSKERKFQVPNGINNDYIIVYYRSKNIHFSLNVTLRVELHK